MTVIKAYLLLELRIVQLHKLIRTRETGRGSNTQTPLLYSASRSVWAV